MRLFAPSGLANRLTLLIVGDLACVEVATGASLWLLDAAGAASLPAHQRPALAIELAIVWFLLLYLRDFYAIARPRARANVAANLFMIALSIGPLAATAALAVPALRLSLSFCLMHAGFTAVLVALWRLFVFPRVTTRISVRVAILGAGARADLLRRELERHAHLGYRLASWSNKMLRIPRVVGSDLSGGVADDMAEQDPRDADVLVVSDADEPPVPISDLLAWRMAGVQVFDFESFYEHLAGKIPLPLVREAWLLFAPGFRRPSWSQRLKRLLDLSAATVLGMAAAPLMLLAGVAIKLDSAGPIFYSQERVGLNGRVFRLYKFRSMRSDAEKLSGAVWAVKGDLRVTRVGRLIRRLRIDELPQLWNVLKGDMSLIGPRPERPEFVARLVKAIPLYHYRHCLRPGITGWAQVCFPYGATVEEAQEKLCYDLYYIKNWSLVFDVQILLQTVKVVLLGRGGR